MKKIFLLLFLSILVFVGCNSQSDETYFELAQKSMDAKDYATALVNYQKIVDEFPKSKFYKKALLQTGELNHGYVNKKLTREESLTKAITIYKEFYKKYPKDEKAAQTLFMVGFIQANELGKIDEAKATYEKFLELYPESEMVESAKSEIKNLGLSLNEILNLKGKE